MLLDEINKLGMSVAIVTDVLEVQGTAYAEFETGDEVVMHIPKESALAMARFILREYGEKL